MRFRRQKAPDEPEINLIPFIDVLLVVLIFLMLTTTYARLTALRVQLPTANADAQQTPPARVLVAVAADGRYAVERSVLEDRSVRHLAEQLSSAAHGNAETLVVIDADANAPHQAVINVMDAARRAGLARIVFATKSNADAS